jgi:hypothetical protein
VLVSAGHEGADGGGRGVEQGHVVLVAHLPAAAGIGVGGHTWSSKTVGTAMRGGKGPVTA